MAKRTKTSIPNIVVRENGTLYYRKGDMEISLETDDLKLAVSKKLEIEGGVSFFGASAFKYKIGPLWPAYDAAREKQFHGKSKDGIKIRERTLFEIRYIWKKYLRHEFSTCRLVDLDEVRWNKYVSRSKQRDMRNDKKVMLGFLNHCKQKGLLKYIPDLKVPKTVRRKRRILTPDEVKLLLSNSRGKLLLYNCLYLFMATRNFEITTLPWSLVNIDEGYLYLHEDQVKTGKGRGIPINQIVLKLLIETKARQEEKRIITPYVFPKRGDPSKPTVSTGLRKQWEKAIELCGWDVGYVTPHDLRATYEYYAHKNTAFTDTQKEKFAGAKIDVQKSLYVSFQAADLIGLEEAVQIEGIDKVVAKSWDDRGKAGERK